MLRINLLAIEGKRGPGSIPKEKLWLQVVRFFRSDLSEAWEKWIKANF